MLLLKNQGGSPDLFEGNEILINLCSIRVSMGIMEGEEIADRIVFILIVFALFILILLQPWQIMFNSVFIIICIMFSIGMFFDFIAREDLSLLIFGITLLFFGFFLSTILIMIFFFPGNRGLEPHELFYIFISPVSILLGLVSFYLRDN